ncbi:hypothetical protein [Planomicrobium okeanokoites]|nr:hypothetical protein [Planomicrobium okeanokoites]
MEIKSKLVNLYVLNFRIIKSTETIARVRIDFSPTIRERHD